jgi:hypothetical protein
MRTFSSILLLVFLTNTFIPTLSQAQVWQDTNSWSAEWESEYAKWVEANWTVDFFSRKTLPNGEANRYYGLRVDCADTVYSTRVIFAAEHALPFVMQDPTTYDQVVSNRMTRWNGTTNSAERMRKFLRFVYDLVSTHSLPNDTIPVPISREFIHAGALIRTTEVNHHSWSVKRILPIGVPHLVFNSTVTALSTLTLQQRISWPNPYWVFEGNFTPSSNAGFRYWRPQEFLLIPTWKVPNYSEEQFRIPLAQWENTVQKKLALKNEGDEEKVTRLFQTACEAAKTRVESVNDGLKALRALSTSCMDFATYDTVSTPSRDQRFFDDLVSLRKSYKAIMKTNSGASLSPALKSEMAHMFPFPSQSARSENQQMSSTPHGNSSCLITYGPGRTIDLAEAKRRMFAGLISNNPMDEIDYRWGEVRGPSPAAQACPSWDVWVPNMKQAD